MSHLQVQMQVLGLRLQPLAHGPICPSPALPFGRALPTCFSWAFCRSLVVFPFVDLDPAPQQPETLPQGAGGPAGHTSTDPQGAAAPASHAGDGTVTFRDTYNHCVIIVTGLAEGDFLADVGFGAGNGLVDPVRMPLCGGCCRDPQADSLEVLGDDHACPPPPPADDPWAQTYQHR